MGWRGRPKTGQAERGQGRLRPAGVARAARPFHQAIVHEPVHEPGHAALRQQERIRQPAHPETPVGGLGKVKERLVLLEGESVEDAEVLVKAPRDTSVGAQEGSPRCQLGVTAGRARGLLGVRHGRIVPAIG